MAAQKSQNNGKLVDTWYYQYKGIPGDDNDPSPKVVDMKVAVKVYIFKSFEGQTPPLTTKEVWFGIECSEIGLTLKGPDIEALRAAMWDKLDDHFEVKWERYYLVEIRSQGPYDGLGAGLTFGYTDVYKGIAYDGTELLKQFRYSQGLVIKPWPGEFTDKQGNVVACIPANEANELALKEFSARVDILRCKLVDMVRPDAIEYTLLNLSSNHLLAAPSEDK